MRKQMSLILLTLAVVFWSSVTLAAIKYISSDGGGIKEVAAVDVEKVCGKNFVFRDVNKSEVAAYLHQDIVKASLTESIISELSAVIQKLKNSPGQCSWVTPDEFGKW